MKKVLGVTLGLLAFSALRAAQPDYPTAIWRSAYSGHWYTTGYAQAFTVIHVAEGYYYGTISYFQRSDINASSHYVVNSDYNPSDGAPVGEVTQMVEERHWAWHALCWNRYMFGTEHEGFVSNPAWFTTNMYQASANLHRYLCNKYNIPKDRNHVIGHDEKKNGSWITWMQANWPAIDPTCNTHTDPGQYWDWNYYMALIAQAPSAPTNLNATPLSTSSIKLTWSDTATNESGFKIERALASGGPWSQIATTAVNVVTYTNTGLTPSTVYYYRVRAYNTNGDSAYSNIRSATTGNAPPTLAPIGSKTVVEGNLLTFTATATDPGQGTAVSVTDFETYGAGSTDIMFRHPNYSGSTRGLDTNAAYATATATSFPAGHAGATVLKVNWSFLAGVTNAWIRLTTYNANGFPNPVIDFQQVLKFDIYTDKALKVGLGLRETTNAVGTSIGSNGGASGGIEWVGITNSLGGQPMPTRTVSAGSWQTLSFNLPYELAVNFAGGNGLLSTASGLGVLEHLALVPTATNGGAYNVYLDNFSVVYSNTMTFSLDAGAPAGASIDPRTGVFTWRPTEDQGPGTYGITVRVTDNATPPLDDFETVTVVVYETNSPPTLAAISNKTVNEGSLLTFTVSATDTDLPPNTLTFTLDAGAPAGASIDPTTGVFTWTPTEAQGPSTNSITVRVTDNGSPPLNDARTFTVTVNEVNQAPVLAAIPDAAVDAGTTLTFTNSASDVDLPANLLTYSLDPGAPSGASINPTTGMFTWTPTLAQGNTTNLITVRVTDDGTPAMDDAKSFTVAVTVLQESITATLSLASDTVTINWNSISGKTYRVQYKSNLDDTNWTDLSPDVLATGSTSSKADALTPGSRYYRIVIVE